MRYATRGGTRARGGPGGVHPEGFVAESLRKVASSPRKVTALSKSHVAAVQNFVRPPFPFAALFALSPVVTASTIEKYLGKSGLAGHSRETGYDRSCSLDWTGRHARKPT